MTLKIRIFSSFGDSSKCKDIYERLCEAPSLSNYGLDKEIYITNGDDYTHVLILNTAMPDIKHIPKQNVIGLAFEPYVYLGLTEEFVQYAIKYIGKYFIGDTMGLPEPFIEGFSYMWHNPPLKQLPIKTKIMSMMISDKASQSGHIYRHELVQKILQTNLPIDIYGRGCKFYKHLNDPRIRGEFVEGEPYNDYQYHICIENCQTNHYFSEKIMNPLLANTIPIYLGCRNIDSYFPDMVIKLSGNIEEDISILRQLIIDTKFEKPTNIHIDIEKVKNTIYLLRNIDTIFT
jgi:hypothetical protein